MSDSFADLWNSSVPQKKQQSLASLAQNTQSTQYQQRKPQPDLFTLLSSSSNSTARSTPSLRSLTPSNNPTPPPQPQSQTKSSTDAFSDLLSSSSFSSTSTQNLTIAQRAALADKQRQQALQAKTQQQKKEESAWAGLDSLGGLGLTPSTASVAPVKPTSSSALADDDDWGLGDFGSSASGQAKPQPSLPAKAAKNANDDWDFEDFESSQSGSVRLPAPAAAAAMTKPSNSLWDLDEFTSQSTTNTKGNVPSTRIDSPSNDFDFGNREDGLLNGTNREEDADDDFLGVFNKPPQRKHTPSPRPSHRQSSTPSPSSTSNTRGSSPPPHILGQIIEMGFSIPRAKAALAANNNDVQAALDQLLSSADGPNASGRGTPSSATTATTTAGPDPTPQYPNSGRRRDRDVPREREREQRRTDNNVSPAGSGTGSSDLQAQAEQLLAQASEIGRGMFTKASLFWKEKKEQVQKVVEEQVTSTRGGATGLGPPKGPIGAAGSNTSGRPRWMQESPTVEENSPIKGGSFRDDDGWGEPQVRIPRRLDRQRDRERERAREREDVSAPSQPLEPEIDLFAASESVPPVSFPTSIHASPHQHARSSPAPALPRRAPTSTTTRRPKFSRELAPIPSTIAALKTEANSTFKLGQFGNAEALYTRAIDVINKTYDHHVYFVPLLNNRANARIKVGDISGAVKDCENVISVVCKNQLVKPSDDFDALGGGKGDDIQVEIDWEPSLDGENGDGKVRVPMEAGASAEVVDLGEGLVKAIKRRAEAYEGMEKWKKAKSDWERLRSLGWVRDSVRSEAGRGVSRCSRMLGGEGSTTPGLNGQGTSSAASSQRPTAPKARPKARPSPQPTNPNKPSAVQALRETNAQAEAEDLAKHALKDRIDAKLANWKNGKETNVRALLASLDLVLWEEMLGVKVGMHELVTPAQVKVKYMKAVAKVHPDKLNVNNSTLEQRMIAQGVFAALNDAWIAFKQ